MERTGGVLRRLGIVLAVLAGVLAMPATTALAAPVVEAPSSLAAVAPEVQAKADSGDVKVIAVTDAPGDQVVDDVVATVPGASAQDIKAGDAPQVALTVDAEGLAALRKVPGVETVVEDKVNRITTDQWATAIGLPAAQAAGWTGSGGTVAILDTGVQADHPYLAGKVTAEACFSSKSVDGSLVSLCPGQATTSKFVAGSAAPCVSIPGCEHGTHVAGIAAGGPVATPYALTGVAPSASIIAVKVFSEGTTYGVCGGAPPCVVAWDSDIDAALSWLKTEKDNSNPLLAGLDAVNLSLGGGRYTGACDGSSIKPYVDDLRAIGVATVVAAGNNGSNGSGGRAAEMASPACISSVVSVGATTGSGTVAGYSNLTAATTILAPGTGIYSSVPGVPGSYEFLSGTSMATPVISGALASVRQRYPSYTVDQAVALLRSTGDRINTGVGVMPELQLDNALADAPGTPNRLPGSPFGSVDSVSTTIDSISFGGWAVDPDTAESIPVHVYVDGVGQALTADGSRSDVAAAIGYGSLHGFSGTWSASPGNHTVCFYAINVGAGSNTLLGCREVTVPTGSPFGSVDVVSSGLGTVTVAGWAIDPDTAASIPVHVYVDGVGQALTADGSRSDVGNAYVGYGPLHGFSGTRSASPGNHTVCLYAINVAGAGSNTLLGCRAVTVPTGSPFGSLDVAVLSGGQVVVSGWAIDPDTAASIPVHVYIVAPGYPLTGFVIDATGARSDVASVFPAYGAPHGYSAVLGTGVPAGATVCAYGINVGPVANNTLLGCRVVS